MKMNQNLNLLRINLNIVEYKDIFFFIFASNLSINLNIVEYKVIPQNLWNFTETVLI